MASDSRLSRSKKEKRHRIPQMPDTTTKKSNYEFGRQWEQWVGKYFLERFGGHYDLSPGSRGAADVVNYGSDIIILTQVKATRPDSDAHPSTGIDEQNKLQLKAEGMARARKKSTVAMLALIKGRQVKFKRLALFLPQKE